jgi:hypothetical protein
MNNSLFPRLNEKDLTVLGDALLYMKMTELKKACQLLSLPQEGKKNELIKRIVVFLQTGNILQSAKMPSVSMAKNYPHQPLHPNSLMLYGAYKNDVKTRMFFKKLIGSHFHFTAFGIDWLNDRWLMGNPPSYQEFADYWIEETQRRSRIKSKPKDEWKYINFLQLMSKNHVLLKKEDLMKEWKKLQAEKVSICWRLLKYCL